MAYLTEQQKKLIFDLVVVPPANSPQITDEEFLHLFPLSENQKQSLSLSILQGAYKNKDAEEVEYGLIVGFHFGFTPAYIDALHNLLAVDWHVKHEDVVRALDYLRLPQSVEVLYQTALKHFDYLDFDESFALGVKCIWALRHIGTVEAVEKLGQLAQSDNPILQEKAAKRLYELQQENSSEEVQRAVQAALKK